MILIVGLGNPDKKHEKTRHNVGFRIIDELAASHQLSVARPPRKIEVEIFKGKIQEKEVVVAKPLTYMNNSGVAVKSLITYYSSLITEIWVVHDDIDLALGKIKVSFNRGSAGHKGVESIINQLGGKDFYRFRVGIGPKIKPKAIEKFVLKKFTREEEEIIRKIIKKTADLVSMALRDGIEK